MVVAKTVAGQILEIKRYGSVSFDDRPGWLLVNQPDDYSMRNLRWIHPDDVKLEWIRVFRF